MSFTKRAYWNLWEAEHLKFLEDCKNSGVPRWILETYGEMPYIESPTRFDQQPKQQQLTEEKK